MYCCPHIDAFVDLIWENVRPGMRVAEVGVFDGSTTHKAIEPVFIYGGEYIAIDWFKGTQHPGWETTDLGSHSYKEWKDVYPLFEANLRESPHYSALRVIKSTSEQAASLIEAESLDICFIDANHGYSSVRQDIELYLPKVKKGGILCGHDLDDVQFLFCSQDYPSSILELDTYSKVHLGTCKAVYDTFGKVEVRQCKNKTAPIWIKRL